MGTFQNPGIGYMLDNDGWMLSLQKAPLAEKRKSQQDQQDQQDQQQDQQQQQTTTATTTATTTTAAAAATTTATLLLGTSIAFMFHSIRVRIIQVHVGLAI